MSFSRLRGNERYEACDDDNGNMTKLKDAGLFAGNGNLGGNEDSNGKEDGQSDE